MCKGQGWNGGLVSRKMRSRSNEGGKGDVCERERVLFLFPASRDAKGKGLEGTTNCCSAASVSSHPPKGVKDSPTERCCRDPTGCTRGGVLGCVLSRHSRRL